MIALRNFGHGIGSRAYLGLAERSFSQAVEPDQTTGLRVVRGFRRPA